MRSSGQGPGRVKYSKPISDEKGRGESLRFRGVSHTESEGVRTSQEVHVRIRVGPDRVQNEPDAGGACSREVALTSV